MQNCCFDETLLDPKMLRWILQEGYDDEWVAQNLPEHAGFVKKIRSSEHLQDAIEDLFQRHLQDRRVRSIVLLEEDERHRKRPKSQLDKTIEYRSSNKKGVNFGGRLDYSFDELSGEPFLAKTSVKVTRTDQDVGDATLFTVHKAYLIGRKAPCKHIVEGVEQIPEPGKKTDNAKCKTRFYLRPNHNPFKSGKSVVQVEVESVNSDPAEDCHKHGVALPNLNALADALRKFHRIEESREDWVVVSTQRKWTMEEDGVTAEVLTAMVVSGVINLQVTDSVCQSEKAGYNILLDQPIEEGDQSIFHEEPQFASSSSISGGDLVHDGSMVIRGNLTVDGILYAQHVWPSDERIKTDIKRFSEDAYEKVLHLETVYFKYAKDKTGEQHAGFLAQQVRKHIPEAIKEGEGGILCLKPDIFLPYLVDAVKAINKRVSSLGGLICLAMAYSLRVNPMLEKSYPEEASAVEEIESVVSLDEYSGTLSECSSGLEISDAESESGQNEDKEQWELFQVLSDSDMIEFLLTTFDEKPHLRHFYKKLCADHSRKMVWDIMKAALQLAETDKSRAPGGHFIKMLESKNCKRDIAKLTGKVSGCQIDEPLRKYQKDAIELALPDTWEPSHTEARCNYIFVAPTGSGKTRIFVEVLRRQLEKAPESRAVIIVPTVSLSKQHEATFAAQGFSDPGWLAEGFSSQNSLTASDWPSVMGSHSIVILTAQVLYNLLDDGVAKLSQLDVLIFDECHHAKAEHPYRKIMDFYGKSHGKVKLPQVLGFSASPASGTSYADTYKKVVMLRDVFKGRLVLIDDTHSEIREHVPSPNEENIKISLRTDDRKMLQGIAKFIERGTLRVIRALETELEEDRYVVRAPAGNLLCAVREGRLNAALSIVSELDLTQHSEHNLLGALTLLNDMDVLVDELKEFGYERALAKMSERVVDIIDDFGISSLENVDNSLQSLYAKLLVQLCNTLPFQDTAFVSRAFTTELSCHGKDFPKFLKLVDVLSTEYLECKKQFHGIVFLETRASVFRLSKLLKDDARLEGIDFIEFTGHGMKKKGASFCDRQHRKGMTGAEQERNLDRFRQAGRKVLLATAAAEEGINITTCEFVICYSSPKTGVQRIQAKGRVRRLGSRYITLTLVGSMDEKFDAKSKTEENNLDFVMKRILAIRLTG